MDIQHAPQDSQPNPLRDSTSPKPKRIDLHCHSDASNVAGEAMLNAIACPECYSTPQQVYDQARLRGMDFITLTDHDTIDGALKLAHRDDVIVGEEVTCHFPEDQCKIHLLVWGLDADDHRQLQASADNIYDVAEYVERRQLAHAVAHPVYRQNDRLERWHLERLMLLFKGFECINGAHSSLHREAVEPLLDRLDEAEIARLSAQHGIAPRWPRPWAKTRVGGSDDHGLLNIGRTWTEFPRDVCSKDDLLRCLREGMCRPGGESGSSMKLAHAFYSVAVRYYSRQMLTRAGQKTADLPTVLMQTIVGDRPAPRKSELLRLAIAYKARRMAKKAKSAVRSLLQKIGLRKKPKPAARDAMLPPPPKQKGGAAGLIQQLLLRSVRNHKDQYPALKNVLSEGLPALAKDDEIFRLVSMLNRDVTAGVAAAFAGSLGNGSLMGLFDALAATLAQQAALAPYYIALFYHNRERSAMRAMTAQPSRITLADMKIGLFSDTFDEINGVGRFLRDMGEQAHQLGRSLVIHTCTGSPRFESPCRKNFIPIFSHEMPYYPDLRLCLPPLLEVLEWVDRQQFDAIHLSTPGPMGLIGWLCAKMLRVPILGTYHTDFPAYVHHLTSDHRITSATTSFMSWFYEQMATVFSRSREYHEALKKLGIPQDKLQTTRPGINTDKFNPSRRDDSVFASCGVTQPRRLLYCGRVSVEKNLPMLVEAFAMLCKKRSDTALIVAGDGPWFQTMQKALQGLPAYMLGVQNDDRLAPLYAGCDMFVFPSRTDTLGQVVMEAQASGLPAIVSDEGGPKETVVDNVTGMVLPANSAQTWADAIDQLLNDVPRLQRLSRAAPTRASRFSLQAVFDAFWQEHLAAVKAHAAQSHPERQRQPAP